VHAVDHRSIITNSKRIPPDPVGKTAGETQKPSEQNTKGNPDKGRQGALTSFCESMREFTNGVLRPASNLIPKITYETSVSQTMENLRKKYNGALTGFYNKVHGFAFGILRPETGVIGEETYDSSHSVTMDNLSKEHIGAAAGIKNTIRQYAKKATESIGPPVKVVEPIKLLQHDIQNTSADVPQGTQHVNMMV